MPDALVKTIHLIVRSRDKIFFDQEVHAVTGKNRKGTFDILPYHSNFLSVLQGNLIAHKVDGTDQAFPAESGVLKVKDNQVSCYVNLIPVEAGAAVKKPLQQPAAKPTAAMKN